ncbi:MAG: flagellin lysine-N-methylase [Eubacterium sp.]|nr:flagellin lysine-N-methylase [Eubacterium sp.]
MRLVFHELYERFECTGTDCIYNCCGGWQIPIDDETYVNMQRQPWFKSLLMTVMTRENQLGMTCIREINYRCPYLTKEHLCRFQKNGNMKLMPIVCQQFPRSAMKMGEDVEVFLMLSCCEAARLLLSEPRRYGYVALGEKAEEEIQQWWNFKNDDADLYAALREDEDKMLDFVWDEQSELLQSMKRIYEMAFDKTMYYARADMQGARKVTPQSTCTYTAPVIGQGCAGFYPLTFLNDIIYKKLSAPTMSRRNPPLYRMIKAYKKLYGRLSEAEGEELFAKRTQEILSSHEEMWTAYYSYQIQQQYMRAFEDYYVLGPVLMANLLTQFFMLFWGVSAPESLDEASIMVAGIERTIGNNGPFYTDILQMIRERYFQQ